jgi:hypothetical protein
MLSDLESGNVEVSSMPEMIHPLEHWGRKKDNRRQNALEVRQERSERLGCLTQLSFKSSQARV